MGKVANLVGQTFGRLTVIEFSHRDKNRHLHWKCICSCGNTKVVEGNNLRCGDVRSCGCLRKEKSREIGKRQHHLKHGKCGTRIYNIWHLMIQRCDNPNASYYEYYGGRGIGYCDKWKDFIGFYQDMGNCPKNMTLDRIDGNKDYCKENCRWATRKEQSNNLRNNKLLTYKGKTQSISMWSEEVGINRATLCKRLSLGWGVDRSLTEKVHKEFRTIGNTKKIA